MTRLAGSTVLVTGAGRGLGRQLCHQAVARGAQVVVWDLDPEAVKQVTAELDGAVLAAAVVDVTDREAVEAAAAAIPGGPAAVDVVVNNAGIVSGARFVDLTPEQIERTMAVNVLSLFWVTRPFLPSMIARGSGHVLTVASAAGLVGVAKQTDYSASKHAAVGFAESLRAELRATAPGVTSTVLCPYFIDTGMFEGVRTKVPWLLPILHEPDVVARALDAIEKDRAELLLPWAVRLLRPSRVLPSGLFDRVMDLLGVNATMEHFTGRARTTVAPSGETVPPGEPTS